MLSAGHTVVQNAAIHPNVSIDRTTGHFERGARIQAARQPNQASAWLQSAIMRAPRFAHFGNPCCARGLQLADNVPQRFETLLRNACSLSPASALKQQHLHQHQGQIGETTIAVTTRATIRRESFIPLIYVGNPTSVHALTFLTSSYNRLT